MLTDKEKLVALLQEAESLIASRLQLAEPGGPALEQLSDPAEIDLSTFTRLTRIFETNPLTRKSAIRIIQHLACSGGTLFSKCLAAMPNTTLLSEINPLSTQLFAAGSQPDFCPSDIVSLARIAKAPAIGDLAREIFRADIEVLERHLREYGKRLLLREHSHSIFMGASSRPGKTIAELLGDGYPLRRVITVRHPVESYLALREHDWVHFKPATFEEYCRRYLVFLDNSSGVEVFRYEDLVEDPQSTMEKLCQHLELPFDDNFDHYLELVRLTGDSGRSTPIIEVRPPREIPPELRREMQASACFRQLCQRLEYEEEPV